MSSAMTRPKRLAAKQDMLGALVALGALPKRETERPVTDLAAYKIALDGVTANALAKAVRRILQGVLGHGFFPFAPEFRQQCDRVMRQLSAATEWDRKVHNEIEERKRWEESKPSEESKAWVSARYAEFCRSWPPKGGRK